MSPGAMSPSAVNNRLTPVVVYIALGDSGRAVAKFSKFRVWGNIPEGSILYFGNTLMSSKHSVG